MLTIIAWSSGDFTYCFIAVSVGSFSYSTVIAISIGRK